MEDNTLGLVILFGTLFGFSVGMVVIFYYLFAPPGHFNEALAKALRILGCSRCGRDRVGEAPSPE